MIAEKTEVYESCVGQLVKIREGSISFSRTSTCFLKSFSGLECSASKVLTRAVAEKDYSFTDNFVTLMFDDHARFQVLSMKTNCCDPEYDFDCMNIYVLEEDLIALEESGFLFFLRRKDR